MSSIEPNIVHALGALVACRGGALVTTNMTDATLLAMIKQSLVCTVIKRSYLHTQN